VRRHLPSSFSGQWVTPEEAEGFIVVTMKVRPLSEAHPHALGCVRNSLDHGRNQPLGRSPSVGIGLPWRWPGAPPSLLSPEAFKSLLGPATRIDSSDPCAGRRFGCGGVGAKGSAARCRYRWGCLIACRRPFVSRSWRRIGRGGAIWRGRPRRAVLRGFIVRPRHSSGRGTRAAVRPSRRCEARLELVIRLQENA
jgi:hypothetical protein